MIIVHVALIAPDSSHDVGAVETPDRGRSTTAELVDAMAVVLLDDATKDERLRPRPHRSKCSCRHRCEFESQAHDTVFFFPYKVCGNLSAGECCEVWAGSVRAFTAYPLPALGLLA